jgi:hypothetical protein
MALIFVRPERILTLPEHRWPVWIDVPERDSRQLSSATSRSKLGLEGGYHPHNVLHIAASVSWIQRGTRHQARDAVRRRNAAARREGDREVTESWGTASAGLRAGFLVGLDLSDV